MSDELIRTTQSMKRVSEALERFLDSAVAARQRVSDATWADLLQFKSANPEVTLDDIIEIHEGHLKAFDAKYAEMLALREQLQKGHSAAIDAILDTMNRPGQ